MCPMKDVVFGDEAAERRYQCPWFEMGACPRQLVAPRRLRALLWAAPRSAERLAAAEQAIQLTELSVFYFPFIVENVIPR